MHAQMAGSMPPAPVPMARAPLPVHACLLEKTSAILLGGAAAQRHATPAAAAYAREEHFKRGGSQGRVTGRAQGPLQTHSPRGVQNGPLWASDRDPGVEAGGGTSTERRAMGPRI